MTGDISTFITGTHKPSQKSQQTTKGPSTISAQSAHVFCELKYSERPWIVYVHGCKTKITLHPLLKLHYVT